MKTIKIIILIIAVAFVAIQLVPVKRDNPAGPDTFNAPPDVKKIVERSCYDCHSNRTRWPWYSHVAPESWIIADHVHEGRRKLNFSNWGNLPENKKLKNIGKMSDEIEENGMPLPQYLKLHPTARLTLKDKQTIYKWSLSVGGLTGED